MRKTTSKGKRTQQAKAKSSPNQRCTCRDTTGEGKDKAVQQQTGSSLNQVPPRRSVLGYTAHTVGQAWMYITDEAAAVAAEGPEGLDKAAQHHLPMPKPHLQFNITSEGQSHTLLMHYLPNMLVQRPRHVNHPDCILMCRSNSQLRLPMPFSVPNGTGYCLIQRKHISV